MIISSTLSEESQRDFAYGLSGVLVLVIDHSELDGLVLISLHDAAQNEEIQRLKRSIVLDYLGQPIRVAWLPST